MRMSGPNWRWLVDYRANRQYHSHVRVSEGVPADGERKGSREMRFPFLPGVKPLIA